MENERQGLVYSRKPNPDLFSTIPLTTIGPGRNLSNRDHQVLPSTDRDASSNSNHLGPPFVLYQYPSEQPEPAASFRPFTAHYYTSSLSPARLTTPLTQSENSGPVPYGSTTSSQALPRQIGRPRHAASTTTTTTTTTATTHQHSLRLELQVAQLIERQARLKVNKLKAQLAEIGPGAPLPPPVTEYLEAYVGATTATDTITTVPDADHDVDDAAAVASFGVTSEFSGRERNAQYPSALARMDLSGFVVKNGSEFGDEEIL